MASADRHCIALLSDFFVLGMLVRSVEADMKIAIGLGAIEQLF